MSQIYVPDNLNELLQILKTSPDALLYSGGTHIVKVENNRFLSLPRDVIDLQQVEDLKKITRTERYIEIGAAVSIRRILRVTARILPRVFNDALSSIGTIGIESLATLGGNLCVPDRIMTTFPVLHVLDARLELRRQGGSRWVSITRFRDSSGRITLEPGEVLTRIRIPLGTWNHQVFQAAHNLYLPETEPLVLCAVARTEKGLLDDFRLGIATHLPMVIRDRELEAELIGRRVPFAKKDRDFFFSTLSQQIEQAGIPPTKNQHRRIMNLSENFLTRVCS